MERDIEVCEELAYSLERGSKRKKHDVLRKISFSDRYCEFVLISLKAMTMLDIQSKNHNEGKQ